MDKTLIKNLQAAQESLDAGELELVKAKKAEAENEARILERYTAMCAAKEHKESCLEKSVAGKCDQAALDQAWNAYNEAVKLWEQSTELQPLLSGRAYDAAVSSTSLSKVQARKDSEAALWSALYEDLKKELMPFRDRILFAMLALRCSGRFGVIDYDHACNEIFGFGGFDNIYHEGHIELQSLQKKTLDGWMKAKA